MIQLQNTAEVLTEMILDHCIKITEIPLFIYLFIYLFLRKFDNFEHLSQHSILQNIF